MRKPRSLILTKRTLIDKSKIQLVMYINHRIPRKIKKEVKLLAERVPTIDMINYFVENGH